MTNAWMIRNDGTHIPVEYHPYIRLDDAEEALFAAQWLFNNTRHEATKTTVINMIKAWALDEGAEEDSLIEFLLDEIEDREGAFDFLTSDFIEKLSNKLEAADVHDDFDTLCARAQADLNQEFLRARYGGMYDTSRGSAEMVFRVSSTGFNWYGIIFDFVAKNIVSNRSMPIKSITIVRDNEATGAVNAYYKTHNGRNLYKQLPLDDFLSENGNPVIEKRHLCFYPGENEEAVTDVLKILREGGPISSLYDLPLNSERLRNKLVSLEYRERRNTESITQID